MFATLNSLNNGIVYLDVMTDFEFIVLTIKGLSNSVRKLLWNKPLLTNEVAAPESTSSFIGIVLVPTII